MFAVLSLFQGVQRYPRTSVCLENTDHPDEAYSPATEKAKTIAGGCLTQARHGTTSGPKGCGYEVRN